MGSKEYTLKAGTYTLSMYVKGEGQVKLGYAVVGEDGKIAGGDSYNYSGYITTDANWKLVTYEIHTRQRNHCKLCRNEPQNKFIR